MNLITNWFRRTFSDPQVVALLLALLVGFVIILTMGEMLAPVLASIVIAFLLEGIVNKLEHIHVPRLIAVIIIFSLFMLFLLLTIFGVMPLVSKQLTQLLQQTPAILGSGQEALMMLPDRYPELITSEQVTELIEYIKTEIAATGQSILSVSFSSVIGLITAVVYLILVPLLVFFLLKDKSQIIQWIMQFFPHNRGIVDQVWRELDIQISNYVRGKFWEIIIVSLISYFAFSILGLHYAELLALLVGLSVIIPYIGAVVVTIPVLLVAWFQWGWSSDFMWLMGSYLIIQVLDGNVLVPLLFSEVVNLHPLAIIIAILVFGGLWGFWGVFFAIPLGTLVKAIINAWPASIATETS